jgi:hypothetical protein
MLLTESHLGGSNPPTTAKNIIINPMVFIYRHMNVPEYNTSFIVPHKSGNTILYSTLTDILQLNSIEFNFFKDELQKNCFLFVRNPVDRFFSSYNWYVKLKTLYNTNMLKNLSKEDIELTKASLKVFEDLEIDSLSKFIEKYKPFINSSNDTHFLPQTSFFLKRPSDNGSRANLNFNFRKEYDNRFENYNYRFFRMEDISDIMKTNKNLLSESNLKNFGVLNKPDIKTFYFLKDFPKIMNNSFIVFHSYYKDSLSEYHHSKNPNYYYDEITLNEYLTVFEMFKKESLFFGYDDEPNLTNKEFKKNVI